MSEVLRPGDMCSPLQAQKLAVEEGYRGAGFVSPNPLVGCVVVSKDGKLLATGYHARVGEVHAEVMALDKIAPELRQGCTMYVTLEPCAHHGRTPPCVDRVIRDKMSKVVIGVLDPNPLVAGKGIAKLKSAGIVVEQNEDFTQQSLHLAEQFLCNMQTGLPFISLKLAMSVDGNMALANGDSHWLTSENTRIHARTLRAHYDATLVGANTILHDNPHLDFRDTPFADKKQNRVFIWDPQKKLSDDKLKQSHVHALHGDRVKILNELNRETLTDLYKDGITSLFVEGGPRTISYMIEHKLFNKLYCFVAPTLLGQGMKWTESLRLNHIDERLRLEFMEPTVLSPDILLTAYPNGR